jgi:bla regulator protein BlaR1
MIGSELPTFARALGPAFANHLWQSTLFAAAAALLTLTLRKNQARVRYSVWLAASVKFLIPFAPLIAVGEHLTWFRTPSNAQAALPLTVEQIAQPFTAATDGRLVPAASPIHAQAASAIFPGILVLLWLAGFLVVLVLWYGRWRRISAIIRQSTPIRAGAELETLRHLENRCGRSTQLALLSSPATLEPGVFGIFRPVLLWPEGISEHLTPEQLEAVLGHELWHVLRRDNFSALIHMLVEAVFWFHPLVWWIGARLIHERECACDERVLEFGGRRDVYAESILKVCEFCVGCPLACVAGVTGSDLKKRMVHIMSEQIGRKLNFSRKLLITITAVLAIAIPVMVGLFSAAPSRAQASGDSATTPTFQSFSIKPSQDAAAMPTYADSGKHMIKMMFGPDGFLAANVTMSALIREAYGIQANQIAGGPDWLNTDRFDVEAKLDKPQTPNLGPRPEKYHSIIRQLLQTELTQHTQLAVHTEMKNLPTYALVVAEVGSKLQPAPTSDNSEGGEGMMGVHRMMMQEGSGGQVVGLAAQGTPMADFASQLSLQLGTPVIDRTGLKGNYNFSLQWAAQGTGNVSDDSAPPSGNEAAQSLSAALQQQLGLKLVPQTQPMPVVVIDHIEKPAEN